MQQQQYEFICWWEVVVHFQVPAIYFLSHTNEVKNVQQQNRGRETRCDQIFSLLFCFSKVHSKLCRWRRVIPTTINVKVHFSLETGANPIKQISFLKPSCYNPVTHAFCIFLVLTLVVSSSVSTMKTHCNAVNPRISRIVAIRLRRQKFTPIIWLRVTLTKIIVIWL